MIGRLKDKWKRLLYPQINPFFAKVKKLKAVLILNRVYSGIDVKKAARKLLILSVVDGGTQTKGIIHCFIL